MRANCINKFYSKVSRVTQTRQRTERKVYGTKDIPSSQFGSVTVLSLSLSVGACSRKAKKNTKLCLSALSFYLSVLAFLRFHSFPEFHGIILGAQVAKKSNPSQHVLFSLVIFFIIIF